MVKAFEEEWPQDEVRRRKLEMLLPSSRHEGKKLLYRAKLGVPRKSVSVILELAHDSKTGTCAVPKRCQDWRRFIGDI